jgi:hypothetical protein
MNSDSIISVYSDARAEYTKQLCVFLVPAYFKFFIDLLEKAKEITTQEPKKALWQFQTFLNEIHDWNMEKVNNEIHSIYNNCGCDYLEDLLTAVFIAHTKILTAIRLNSSNKKVNITVPKVEHFLFKVLCECSKLLWSSTFLFRDGISSIEKQQNYRSIEHILNEGILQAIRSLVPVKSILKDFVKNDESEINENDDSDDEKDIEPEQKNVIKEDSLTENEETFENSEKIESEQHSIIEETVTSNTPVISNNSQIDYTYTEQNENNTQINEETVIKAEEETNTTNEPISELNEIHTVDNITEPDKNIANVIKQDNPVINIEERPVVQFADFDALFDSDNPLDSEMIFDPKDEELDETPGLEIPDTEPQPLDEGLDFDELDENIKDDEYHVLV